MFPFSKTDRNRRPPALAVGAWNSLGSFDQRIPVLHRIVERCQGICATRRIQLDHCESRTRVPRCYPMAQEFSRASTGGMPPHRLQHLCYSSAPAAHHHSPLPRPLSSRVPSASPMLPPHRCARQQLFLPQSHGVDRNHHTRPFALHSTPRCARCCPPTRQLSQPHRAQTLATFPSTPLILYAVSRFSLHASLSHHHHGRFVVDAMH
ncbi:hypothetical protein B0H17DRAFT_1342276 [Mycena rosella]|uniref:Uncharacterized protein n=1 Tax=Mycena rosella TaxID=1033263 RepID=A0AAD7AX55_MYCRO|nr:hypothetical protein B0H17DRAFT_1342276 [Mycena rosella]